MNGKLYLVGTPIGNLGDLTPRAADTLAQADFIAAEDTRVTLRLLSHLGLKKPMLSYHEHNRESMGNKIVSKLLSGESCALCTDAGMPCISDPGQDLVALCAQSGIEVVAIPGPTALATALALSGIAGGRFVFEGFLSVKKGSRQKHLAALKSEERTMIFYEAPHKLPATLEDMLANFGERKISLCRELTKLHEECVRTTLSEAAAHYREHPPRGEYVLVIEGAPPPSPEQAVSEEEAVALVKQLQAGGLSLSQAAKDVAGMTGHKKTRLYTLAANIDS
ncbi:MAG: 16S rRNA (cytidine(1402)-2'-O)-methyltransferase [Oscillospiraceae bacterium]|nr:16S rRNA (cytidine(1402)-2'-O)-methyltransferase [Oscillospiraceae bacterium]